MKFVFKKYKDEDNRHDVSDVMMKVETNSLEPLFEEFKGFLLACGFVIDGNIVIEPKDE